MLKLIESFHILKLMIFYIATGTLDGKKVECPESGAEKRDQLIAKYLKIAKVQRTCCLKNIASEKEDLMQSLRN